MEDAYVQGLRRLAARKHDVSNGLGYAREAFSSLRHFIDIPPGSFKYHGGISLRHATPLQIPTKS